MEAGRELDALIAEKVMGWMRVNSPHKITGASGEPSGFEPIGGGYATFAVVPHYSTGIAAAWLVVDAMRARGAAVLLRYDMAYANEWEAGFGVASDKFPSAHAPTAPHAICRAALAALEEPAE
jgi:hypothetical protein